jgi:regulator of sigma E protease
VMALVLYQGARVAANDDPVIGSFTETSVAKAAGLQPGDRIVSVDGTAVDSWQELQLQIVPKANRRVHIVAERNGRHVEVDVVPAAQGKFEIGDIGVVRVMRPQIRNVFDDSPAKAAGLQAGDVILAVGSERGVTRERAVELIKAHENKPLVFEIEREGQTRTITVTPRRVGDTPMIGAHIDPLETRVIEPGPFEAVKMSFEQNWDWSKLIVKTLVGLFTRETSVKQLMGPVAIADLSGSAAAQGWLELFSLMGMISLNLGLLNLMPIPVLDGGHITILALEGLARRDFSMKVKEKMLLAGFALLLMLMVTVIYNDLTRVQWIERLMPWR